MDMALYALLKNTLDNQSECKTWNGYRIEVVDELPEVQNTNTIYLVKLGTTHLVTTDGANLVTKDGDELTVKN
jgi:hypothetical protein